MQGDRGAGAWLDSEDPALSEWYTDAQTGAIDVVEGQPEIEPGSSEHRAAIEPPEGESRS